MMMSRVLDQSPGEHGAVVADAEGDSASADVALGPSTPAGSQSRRSVPIVEVTGSGARRTVALERFVGGTPTVVVVVWTYNRYEVVRACLESITRQSVQIDGVIVVDSHSEDDTVLNLRHDFPNMDVVVLEENDGMAAAIAAGIRSALTRDPDFVWLVEDDTVVGPMALENALALAVGSPQIGMVGPVGASVRHGLWKWKKTGPDEFVDFCMLDGALISRAAIEAAGVPDEGYFIMLVDVEYPLRINRAGFKSLRSSSIEIDSRQLGAAAIEERRPWRAYYQTRNHLRMAIDMRSLTFLVGFTVRTFRMVALAMLRGRAGLPEIAFRIAGVRDGAFGRMGRRVEPSIHVDAVR
jgi:GT2 family glycosyltransferase